MCKPVDSGQNWTAFGLLMYLGQPGVAKCSTVHMQIKGNFMFLSDAVGACNALGSCISQPGMYR